MFLPVQIMLMMYVIMRTMSLIEPQPCLILFMIIYILGIHYYHNFIRDTNVFYGLD